MNLAIKCPKVIYVKILSLCHTHTHACFLSNGFRHARAYKRGLPCLDPYVPCVHLLSGRCASSSQAYNMHFPVAQDAVPTRKHVCLVLEFRKQRLTHLFNLLAKRVKLLLESPARRITLLSSHCQKRMT